MFCCISVKSKAGEKHTIKRDITRKKDEKKESESQENEAEKVEKGQEVEKEEQKKEEGDGEKEEKSTEEKKEEGQKEGEEEKKEEPQESEENTKADVENGNADVTNAQPNEEGGTEEPEVKPKPRFSFKPDPPYHLDRQARIRVGFIEKFAVLCVICTPLLLQEMRLAYSIREREEARKARVRTQMLTRPSQHLQDDKEFLEVLYKDFSKKKLHKTSLIQAHTEQCKT